MKKLINFLPWFSLIFAVAFNLWLIRAELNITSDPNDSIFQFALVNRANIVWENTGNLCPNNLSFVFCHLSSLIDHWAPEWAEGYPLPFYYSHLPQIAIVASYQLLVKPLTLLFNSTYSLFDYYHLLTYLTLAFFPLPVLWATRVSGFSPLTQAFAVLFASHISTDGLYGMDNSSYLWRGYGLSAQLFATFFLPLAFAYSYAAVKEVRKSQKPNSQPIASSSRWPGKVGHSAAAILTLTATFSAHFGLGYIASISLLPLPFLTWNRREILARAKKLLLIIGTTLALLSYWFIPFLLQSKFNAISPWDPVWKFDSFGHVNVLTRFFEGELIDFGRLPILTALTLIGFFVVMLGKNRKNRSDRTYKTNADPDSPFLPLALLLPLWLLLLFGRTTWGPLLKLLPGAEGFHLHRFINGLHLAVLFLSPLGASWVASNLSNLSSLSFLRKLPKSLHYFILTVIVIIVLIAVYRQTRAYAQPNAEWLAKANQAFAEDWPDFKRLTASLDQLPPGRIYAGKPGYWGKGFRLADTPIYMALSVRGYEISQFLPETWSPNSDTEQFFDERAKHHYDLYNLRYVVAPAEVILPEFVQLRDRFGKFLLYEVATGGYFTIARSNLAVKVNRTNYRNIVHLWQVSPLVEQKSFPSLALSEADLLPFTNTVEMLDDTTYTFRNGDGREISLFSQSPLGLPQNYATPSAIFTQEQVAAGQSYQTNVFIPPDCNDCLAVFKATYHPNWQIKVDGKPADKQIVFPFFIGIPLTPGQHSIVASYQPSRLKLSLLALITLGLAILLVKTNLRRLTKLFNRLNN